MTPLEEMDLSVRTYNCLRRAGITTIELLTDMTREQFRSTLGLGSNCMNETEERMDEMGLSFRKANGGTGSTVHTYWTQKGRIFIYDLMKKTGILPLMER